MEANKHALFFKQWQHERNTAVECVATQRNLFLSWKTKRDKQHFKTFLFFKHFAERNVIVSSTRGAALSALDSFYPFLFLQST